MCNEKAAKRKIAVDMTKMDTRPAYYWMAQPFSIGPFIFKPQKDITPWELFRYSELVKEVNLNAEFNPDAINLLQDAKHAEDLIARFELTRHFEKDI